MKQYKCKAAYPNGKTVKAVISAESTGQVKESLAAKGLIMLDCCEVSRNKHRTLKPILISEFCRELSAMMSSGVPISRALEIIIQKDRSEYMRSLFEGVYDSIKQGSSLSSAMDKQNVFPSLLINMVVSGETNGRLDKVLLRMADHYEKEHRTRSEIRSAMFYPMILAVITLLVIIVIFTFIFPMFSELLTGAKLPVITQIMFSVSSLFTEKPYILIISVAVVLVVILYLKSIDAVRRAVDKAKLKAPVIGKLMRTICTARFARTFSSLYSGGIPVISSLEISFSALGNMYISSQANSVILSVKSGSSLSAALSVIDGFDGRLAAALTVGEESGKVDELLQGISNTYEHDSSLAVKKLIKLIEPIMIFIMAAVILLVVLSVMLPIYDIYSNIGA